MQEIDTSSPCPQLWLPQPLCRHCVILDSLPLQLTSSNQILPLPAPKRRPTNCPIRLCMVANQNDSHGTSNPKILTSTIFLMLAPAKPYDGGLPSSKLCRKHIIDDVLMNEMSSRLQCRTRRCKKYRVTACCFITCRPTWHVHCVKKESHLIICCNFNMPASKRTKFGT